MPKRITGSLTSCENCDTCYLSKYCKNCIESDDCEYCNDCIRCLGCEYCNDSEALNSCDYTNSSSYSDKLNRCNHCVLCSNCIDCNRCDQCYESMDCNYCKSCRFCFSCTNCTLCGDCTNCNNLFGSNGFIDYDSSKYLEYCNKNLSNEIIDLTYEECCLELKPNHLLGGKYYYIYTFTDLIGDNGDYDRKLLFILNFPTLTSKLNIPKSLLPY